MSIPINPISTINSYNYTLPSGWYMLGVPAASVVGADCVPPYLHHDVALREISPARVRVCILLADPYPHPGKAMGRALGISPDWGDANRGKVYQSSFGNAWKAMCAADGVPSTIACPDLTLSYLSKQGVLFLNTALTTTVNQPGAHHRHWKKCVENVLKQLPVHCVIAACGAPAFNMALRAGRTAFGVSHPCRYSANRSSSRLYAFTSFNIFEAINRDVHPSILWTRSII